MEISIETKYYEWPIWGCSCPTKFVNRWSGVQISQPAPIKAISINRIEAHKSVLIRRGTALAQLVGDI